MNIVVQYRCQQCMSPMCLGGAANALSRIFFSCLFWGQPTSRDVGCRNLYCAPCCRELPPGAASSTSRPASAKPQRCGARRGAAYATIPLVVVGPFGPFGRLCCGGRRRRQAACPGAAAGRAGRSTSAACGCLLLPGCRLSLHPPPAPTVSSDIRVLSSSSPTAPPPDPRQTVPRPCHHPGCACAVCAAGSLCPPTRTRPARPPAASPPPR